MSVTAAALPNVDLPSDWTVSRIAESCHAPEYGHTASADQAPVGPRFLRITDIQESGVEWNRVPYCRCDESSAEKLALRSGDVLVARIGGTTGKTFLVRECPAAVFASYLIRIRARSVDPEFLYYFTKSELYWRQVDAHKADKLKGGISGSVLKSLVHPCPSLPEQRAIAHVLAAIERRIMLEEPRVMALRQLKAATMAKLFREGLRGEPLKQTEIGEIPRSWQILPLAELCSPPDGLIQTGPFGSQLHASDYVDGGIPIVNPTHMADGRVEEGGIPTVSAGHVVSLARHTLREGDILFSRRGDVGRHALVSARESGWLCGTGCLLVRPRSGAVDPAYLTTYFDSPFAQAFLKTNAAGTIMPNTNTKILSAIPVAVPSNEEQRTIAAALESLNAAIHAATRRFERFRHLFGAVLQPLMAGKLRVDSDV
jgi:type I restriction enzyme S subunit